jgi:hypothetical protein
MIRTTLAKFGCAAVAGVSLLGVTTVAAAPDAVAKATPPSVIILTNSSSGSTVVAVKGDIVRVKLTATGGVHWTEASVVPSTSVPPLVKTSDGVTSTGSSVTNFKVVGYGSAQLEAIGTPTCTPSVCPTYVVLWEATVDVPVVDPPPPST